MKLNDYDCPRFVGNHQDSRPERRPNQPVDQDIDLLERWRVHYNTEQLHGSLGYRPPAPEAVLVTRHSNQITT